MFVMDQKFSQMVLETLKEELPKMEAEDLYKAKELLQMVSKEIEQEVTRRKRQFS